MGLRVSLRFLYCCLFTYAFPSDIVVQSHRGNIIEGLGCIPVIDNITLSYPLILVWVPFLSFVAAVYACLSFRIFLSLRRRNITNRFFSSGYSISKDYYLRLMGFSLVPLLVTFPLTLTSFILNIKVGPRPWISWEATHSNFDRFESYPAAVTQGDPYVYANWMINLCGCLVCCYLFFIFLGTNPEQIRQYRQWFFVILRPFGIKPAPSPPVSPTVWQPTFRRSIPTIPTTPTTPNTPSSPTPLLTFTGNPASISTIPVAHRPRDAVSSIDVRVVGKENFEHNYQKVKRGEGGTPREERLDILG